MSEHLDEDAMLSAAQAKLEMIREQLRARGKFELPAQPVAEVTAEIMTRLPHPAFTEKPPSALRPVGTWEPPCVTVGCGQPLGYLTKEGSYGAIVTCETCRARNMGDRLRLSGISHIEINEPLDELKGTGEAFTGYMAYCARFAALKPYERLDPPFAFVYGSNGVGKSAAAARAMRDAIKRGCQGRFVTLQGLLSEIYDAYGSAGAADQRVFFSNVHLLVVDDVGHEHATDHSMSVFFELVNNRWRNQLPTIFTANYAPDQASLGAVQRDNEARMNALLDRIGGGAGANVFLITGKSKRGAKRA